MPLIGRKSLDKAIDKAIDVVNAELIGVYVFGLRAIITGTPVHFKDGGRLKNSWFLTVGQPSTKTRNSNASGSSSFAEVGKLPDNVLGKKIFFTSNEPYANTVEYGGFPNPVELGTWTGTAFQKLSSGGYSRQAPSGMARISIKKMKSRIKKL
jgi:hypothetical protein